MARGKGAPKSIPARQTGPDALVSPPFSHLAPLSLGGKKKRTSGQGDGAPPVRQPLPHPRTHVTSPSKARGGWLAVRRFLPRAGLESPANVWKEHHGEQRPVKRGWSAREGAGPEPANLPGGGGGGAGNWSWRFMHIFPEVNLIKF